MNTADTTSSICAAAATRHTFLKYSVASDTAVYVLFADTAVATIPIHSELPSAANTTAQRQTTDILVESAVSRMSS
jgi:hypothetical protein